MQSRASSDAATTTTTTTTPPFAQLSSEVKKWLFTPTEHSEEREQMCRDLEQLESRLFSKQGVVQCRMEESTLIQDELAQISPQENEKREALQQRLIQVTVSEDQFREIAQLEEDRTRLLNEYWHKYFTAEWPEALANSASSALQRNIMMASPNVQLAAANMVSLRAQQQQQQQGKKRSIDLVNSSSPSHHEDSAAAGAASGEEAAIKCNCKKSRCLKLYCECFAARRMCVGECKCADCANNAANGKKRDEAIRTVLDRRPDAFHTKVFVATGNNAAAMNASNLRNSTQKSGAPAAAAAPALPIAAAPDQVALAHARGCTCRKTKCTKKYCVCFNTSVKCGDWCRCVGCENGKEEEAPAATAPPASNSAATATTAQENAMLFNVSNRLIALADVTVAFGEEEKSAAAAAAAAATTTASIEKPE